jgi:signal transduction histidine kinase
VVSSIGLFVFIQNRNQKKLNTKLQQLNTELDKANQIKMKFFGILNHDLRSPIANLIHLLELQTNKTLMLDEETKLAMQANTLNSAENLLNSMEDMLLWSKGQMENFQPNFKSINVKNIFAYLEQYFSGTDNVKFEFEINSNIVVISDEDYLQTICRNLTSNAVKATNTVKKPIITWKAWSENQINYLSVSDNGSGIQSEKLKALYDENQVVGIKTGLGLHLIRDLAKAINCIISIQTELNQGSTFIIQFPPKTDK